MTKLRIMLFILAAAAASAAQQTAAPSLPDAPKPKPKAEAKVKPDKPPPQPGTCRYVWVDTPAEAPLQRLSSHEKAKLAACDFLHPFTYIYAIGDSSISTAINAHSDYGPGAKGIAKRFGVDMTDELADDVFSTYLFPTLFHQDPHFHPLGPGHPTHSRVRYAMTRVFIAKRDDDRGNTINAGEIFGTAVTSTLANTYHPGTSQGFGNTAGRVAVSIASDAGYNIWKEYEPQMTKRLKLRFDVVRRLAQKITFQR
jgi:hypothetical protein